MKALKSTTCLFNRSYYRTVISFLLILLSFTAGKAQTVSWAWMSGDNAASQAAVYGTKGTAAAANKPSARDSHSGWKDASGNFWIFGGIDYNGQYNNDLWKYTTSTGQWTWVSGDNATNRNGVYGAKGVAAAGNKPGSRQGQTAWTDASGNFWIFGGQGYNSTGSVGYLNDLWRYNPTTDRWTWISGDNAVAVTGVYGTKGVVAATNKPGGRGFVASWIDASGNFWIFGGLGRDGAGNSGDLNDLWRYNPTTDRWTWISGDNTRNNTGIYGTKGTAAAANKPGSRDSHSGWVDATGNFWLFGGEDAPAGNVFNDLWKYNPGTGQWTWMSGDNTTNNTGVYGTKGTGAAANKPGGRAGQNVVIDAMGNVWLLGGNGYGASGGKGYLNDLWRYKPSTDTWIWENGDNAINSAGVYGTKGTGAAANTSGARAWGAAWLDGTNNLWVFGGVVNTGDINDLWRFTSLTILPLHDITLRGTHGKSENVLSWTTVGEVNTEQFIIERSANGTDFTAVGTVAAAGTGDHRYSFTDYNAIGVTFYYRIQVKDVDGQVYYSPLITLAGSSDARLSVSPNPARSFVVLQVNNSLLNTVARLYDAAGRLVGEFRISNMQQHIDLHRFTNGVFTLQLNNGKTFTIIKQ
ncbi:MAG TPA: kelch repeat-containing protein [Niastella sp.]